jgi:hypothetical protein
MQDYWQKQSAETPLFEDILWTRPENRQQAGKLLIVGGNVHSFASVNEAFQVVTEAGAGTVSVLLPDALKKMLGVVSDAYDYAPSTPSGSFARSALQELLQNSAWADAVLLCGDLGRNSETSALLESFLEKFEGNAVLTKDAIDYFYLLPEKLANRPQTTLVISISQLQKLAVALHFTTPFLLSMGLMLLVQALHTFTTMYPVTIVTKELDQLVVATKGQVISMKLSEDRALWQVATAARASVFVMQHPQKPLQAIATAFLPT